MVAGAKSMDREKVIKLLEYYRDIDSEIKFYRRLIKDDEERYYITPGTSIGDGLPKGKNNISRTTENLAMNIPDGIVACMKAREEKVENLYNLKNQILQEISRLEYKEKSIVYDYYIIGLKWEQVALRNHYSERQCKNIRNMAVDSLISRFQKNLMITGFEIKA